MTDQADAVDLNPERCTFRDPESDNGRIITLRCTARADEEHEHHWHSDEQERWVDETRQVIIEAMDLTAERHRRTIVRPRDPDTPNRSRFQGPGGMTYG